MNSSFSPRHSNDSLDSAGCSGLLEVELAQAIKRTRLTLPASPKSESWVKRGAVALLDFLTGQPQIAIRLKYVKGALQWTVYDPSTDTLKRFDSEQAVRAWLARGDT